MKLPHEAIRSKLAGENIIDVREEDLVYFKNLTYIDLSDNSLNMAWVQNLEGLEELDMQYNQMQNIKLKASSFLNLKALHLSYNRVPPACIEEFKVLP